MVMMGRLRGTSSRPRGCPILGPEVVVVLAGAMVVVVGAALFPPPPEHAVTQSTNAAKAAPEHLVTRPV